MSKWFPMYKSNGSHNPLTCFQTFPSPRWNFRRTSFNQSVSCDRRCLATVLAAARLSRRPRRRETFVAQFRKTNRRRLQGILALYIDIHTEGRARRRRWPVESRVCRTDFGRGSRVQQLIYIVRCVGATIGDGYRSILTRTIDKV